MAEPGLPSLGMLVMLAGLLTGIGASLLMPGDTLLAGVCRLQGGLELSGRASYSFGSSQKENSRNETPRSFAFRNLSFPSLESPAARAFESALVTMAAERMNIEEMANTGERADTGELTDKEETADREERLNRAAKPSSHYPASRNTSFLQQESFPGDDGCPAQGGCRRKRDLSPGEELAVALADQAIAFQEYRELKEHPLRGLPLPEKRRLREQLRRERELLPRKLLEIFYRGEPVPLRTDTLSARDRLRLLSVYFGAVWRLLSGELPPAAILLLALLIDSGITRYLRIRDGYLPAPRIYRLCALGAAFQTGAAPVLLIPFLVPPVMLPAVFGGGLITGGLILYGLTLHISARPSSELLEPDL